MGRHWDIGVIDIVQLDRQTDREREGERWRNSGRVTQQERERDTERYRENQKKWHEFGERFLQIPPGNSTVPLLKMAHRNIVDFPIADGDFPARKLLPSGNHTKNNGTSQFFHG